MFHRLDSLLLRLPGEVHLERTSRAAGLRGSDRPRPWRRGASTDLDGEDGGVSDQERFDLEGLAEGSRLVHGAHGSGLVGVDVLCQLLSGIKNKPSLKPQAHNFQSKFIRGSSFSWNVCVNVSTYFPTALRSTS